MLVEYPVSEAPEEHFLSLLLRNSEDCAMVFL